MLVGIGEPSTWSLLMTLGFLPVVAMGALLLARRRWFADQIVRSSVSYWSSFDRPYARRQSSRALRQQPALEGLLLAVGLLVIALGLAGLTGLVGAES